MTKYSYAHGLYNLPTGAYNYRFIYAEGSCHELIDGGGDWRESWFESPSTVLFESAKEHTLWSMPDLAIPMEYLT